MRNLMIYCFLFIVAVSCKKDDVDGNADLTVQVKSFYPNAGKGRTLVTLQGRGFSQDYSSNKVSFNGVAGEVVLVTDSTLVVSAPDDGNTGAIVLQSGSTTLDVGVFTYQTLTLTGVSPLRVAAFDVVTVKGDGFRGNAHMPTVSIGGIDAKITFVSDSTLQVAVPASLEKSGVLEIHVGDQQVSGPEIVVVRVNDYFPKAGFGGGQLTVQGHGFNPTVAGNYVFYKTSAIKWGYNDAGVWGPKTYYYSDTLKIVRATATELVAVFPETVAVQTGTIEVESQGITKVLKSPANPVYTFLSPPTINQLWVPGSVIYVIGSGLETKLEGMRTQLFVGEMEIPADHMSVGDFTIVIERIPAGLKSGLVKVIANGRTVIGPELIL